MHQTLDRHLENERRKRVLARSLDAHMRKAGITQTVLAERAGMNKSTLNTYFLCKSFPSPAKLQALADAFGVRIGELAPVRGLTHDGAAVDREASCAVSAIPDLPGHTRLMVRVELPTELAFRIVALLSQAEAPCGEQTDRHTDAGRIPARI